MGTTFYFDLFEDQACTLDLEGRELPSTTAAVDHAHRSLRFFVSQRALEGVIPAGAYIVMRTATETLAIVSFSDALRLELAGGS